MITYCEMLELKLLESHSVHGDVGYFDLHHNFLTLLSFWKVIIFKNPNETKVSFFRLRFFAKSKLSIKVREAILYRLKENFLASSKASEVKIENIGSIS